MQRGDLSPLAGRGWGTGVKRMVDQFEDLNERAFC